MSTESLETLLACALMILLTLTTMANILPILQPINQDAVTAAAIEKNLRITEYLLTYPGDPVDWGQSPSSTLDAFGLAVDTAESHYTLDIDKVTRLSNNHYYTLPYTDAFLALGMTDKPFQIAVTPIFDVTLLLVSQQDNGTYTNYQFAVSTVKSQNPIEAELQVYTLIGDVILNSSRSVVNGGGTVETSISNTLNGTALVIALACIEPRTYSYASLVFSHNTLTEPHSEGNYAALSPLAHELRVDLTQMIDQVRATCFTFDSWVLLDQITDNTSLVRRYTIPVQVKPGPMIFVVTAFNATTFVELFGYPPISFTYGTDFLNQNHLMNSLSYQFVVNIESALYYATIILGEN
jgi:hypothetical protein